MTLKNDVRKRAQRLYVVQAAAEYLISILVTGSFLATLTKEIGMSDGLTGILSSIISLGCLFQMMSALLGPRKVKGFVVALSVTNQLLFLLLYVIPLLGVGKPVKTAAFVVVILAAYAVFNFAHPPKINWLMSLVEDERRGRFTANKEMVSLLAGMAFSFIMGTLVDHFAAKGQIRTAFLLSAVVMFILLILHTVSLVFTVQIKPQDEPNKKSFAELGRVIRNKNVIRVTIICVFYYIATYIAVPFYGTYQIQELGFSLQFVSVLTILSSVARILVSRFWGAYADKNSFAAMTEKCLIILAAGYVAASAAGPANGKVMFVLYYLCYGVAMGGINSALINLIFDYVEPDKRADSLAVCQAVSGLAGFAATLCGSPLVAYIQGHGNRLFGMSLYAQQVLSFVGLLFTAAAFFYVRTAFKGGERKKQV